MKSAELLQNIKFTGYRPEVATEIIPILARYFIVKWGRDDEFRQRLAQEVEAYLTELDNPLNGVICAWADSKLAGIIAVDGSLHDVQGGWIRWFIVADEYRNSGIGGALFEKAMEYCYSRCFTDVFMSTYKDKDPAMPLYEKYGFVIHKEEDFSTHFTGITKLWLKKSL